MKFHIIILFLMYFSTFSTISAQCPGNSCSVCDISATITSINNANIINGTSYVTGSINPQEESTGSTLEIESSGCGIISFTVELDFIWDQGSNINWIHGVSFSGSGGWSSAQGTVPPNWIWQDEITGDCSGSTYSDGGYYYDGTIQTSGCNGLPFVFPNDGDPSNNWGVDCEYDCPTFGFKLEFCPLTNENAEETISFVLTDDGETGDWDSPANCVFTINIPINITSPGIQLPDNLEPICEGEGITIDAGDGCDTYLWSTGETTQQITVSPTETTTYSVTVGDSNCNILGEIEVVVEPCCEALAGDITLDTSPLCPGEEVSISIENQNEDEDYENEIFIVDENGNIIDLFLGTSAVFSYPQCAEFEVYSYQYLIGGTTYSPMIGDNVSDIDCTLETECCDLKNMPLVFEDTEMPAFPTPPMDITLQCISDTIPMAPLDWTDNCMGSGTVEGMQMIDFDLCSGGTIQRTWSVVDSCENENSYSQTITIEALEEPSFVSLPSDITISCDEFSNFSPIDLDYTNNLSGVCEISGSVSPTSSGSFDVCGGTVTYTWEYTDDCGRTISETQMVTSEPPAEPAFVNSPSDITIDCDEFSNFSPIDLDYTNNLSGVCEISGSVSPTSSGSFDVCGGTVTYTWEYTDDCGRTISETQNIEINPAPQAQFNEIPQDITISCDEVNSPPEDLTVSNQSSGNCEISEIVSGIREGDVSYCGGVITDIWTFVDDCQRTTTIQRSVTVEPSPQAAFIDPPIDITIDCIDLGSIPTSLSYDNGLSGDCAIQGSIEAVVIGNIDPCGGPLIYNWNFEDDCGRAISHSQQVTINPLPDPYFEDLPQDITLDCGETAPAPPSLFFTNGLSGDCNLSGSVAPIVVQNENQIIVTWDYELPCSDEFLSHVQNIYIPPEPEITIAPNNITICNGDSYNLDDISIIESSNQNITITYHSVFPPSESNEISNIISPSENTNIFVLATNEYGCETYEVFSVFVEYPPFAGDDNTAEVCLDGAPLDLTSYEINPGEGSWIDLDGTGINISNPSQVEFFGIEPGSYNLYYIVPGTVSCPDDTMALFLTVIDEISFDVLSVECIQGNMFYEVIINSNGYDITITEGELVHISGNEYKITNIPITENVYISVVDPVTECFEIKFFQPPNCDCPDIAPPQGQDLSICLEDLPYTIEVTVPNGLTANWYDTQDGTTPIVSQSTQLVLNNQMAGTYTFYVESYDPTIDCASSSRLTIKIIINDAPMVKDTSVSICDQDNDGQESLILSEFNHLINDNISNNFTYYANHNDAENNLNALDDQYTLSSTTTLHVVVQNTAGCKSIASIELILAELPAIEYTVFDEVCLDASDGSIVIDDFPMDWMLSWNGMDFSTQEADFQNLPSGDYTFYVKDENGCISTYNFEINQGLDLNVSTFSISCNDNGTNTDASDDYYNITLIVDNNKENNGLFQLLFGNNSQGEYSYGVETTLQHPADGSEIVITIIDTNTGCQITKQIGPLTSCSTNCELSLSNLMIECNDNGTTVDPEDDYYQIQFIVTSINGGSQNSYSLNVNGDFHSIQPYGEEVIFTLPASGNKPSISIQDVEILECQLDTILPALIPCSSECLINMDLEATCFDNGTESQSDDYYEIVLQASIINGSMPFQYTLFIDGLEIGTYLYDENIQFELPADNQNHELVLIDVADYTCIISFNTDTLNPCSLPCEMAIDITNVYCDNNNSNNTSDDDIFFVDLTVTNPQEGSYQIENLETTGSFNTPITIGPFLISDGSIEITIINNDNENCTLDINVDPPALCSDCTQEINAGEGGTLSCEVSSINLEGWSSVPGEYKWYDPALNLISTDITAIADQTGIYTFAVAFDDGCELTDTLIVDSDNSIPESMILSSGDINCEQDTVILTGFSNGTSENYIFYWTDENGTLLSQDTFLIVMNPGVYYLQIEDKISNCKSGNTSMVVNAYLETPIAQIFANPDSVLDCVIKSLLLSPPDIPNAMLVWNANGKIIENEETIEVIDPGIYGLTVIDTISNCRDETQINIVDLVEYPMIELSVNGILSCEQEEVTIVATTIIQDDNFSATWTNEQGDVLEEGTTELTVFSPGSYYFTLIDLNNGCTNTDTIILEETINQLQIDIESTITFTQGQSVQLNLDVNIPEDQIDTIIWSGPAAFSCSDCFSPIISNPIEGDYYVVVMDIYGCEDTGVIHLIKESNPDIFVPDIINPDSDVGNSHFTIYGNKDVDKILSLSIYDRWGNKIFDQKNIAINTPKLGWDGTYKGQKVVSGVYVYIAEILFLDGRKKQISGDLTIIR